MSGDDLSAVEAVFRAAVPPGRLVEFDAGALDRVGVPLWTTWWSAAAGRAPGAEGGMGYGDSPQRARVGSLGELVEHLGARGFAASSPPSPVCSRHDLVREAGEDAVVDPRLLGLPAGTEYDDDRPVHWLATTRWRDGATVWVPREFVASAPGELPATRPPGGWLALPVSNGLGAGTTLDGAVAHAVGEILQRDGNGLVFRALDGGVVVDLDGLDHPLALATLDRLRAAGVDVMVKLASTANGVVNVYAVGAAPGDDVIVATACGEAAHPNRGEAVAKALAEFAAARARKAFMHGPLADVIRVAPRDYLESVLPLVDPGAEEQRVLAAMVEWREGDISHWRHRLADTVFSRRSVVAFTDLPTPPDLSDGVLAYLAGQLAGDGFDILVADLSGGLVGQLGDGPVEGAAPAGRGLAGEGLRAHAVKVIVPGMEVETVAYARLGGRNTRRLLEAGRHDLVCIGARPLPPGEWLRVHLTPAAEREFGGPAWLDRAALDQVSDGLLPLYREPSRHSVATLLERD